MLLGFLKIVILLVILFPFMYLYMDWMVNDSDELNHILSKINYSYKWLINKFKKKPKDPRVIYSPYMPVIFTKTRRSSYEKLSEDDELFTLSDYNKPEVENIDFSNHYPKLLTNDELVTGIDKFIMSGSTGSIHYSPPYIENPDEDLFTFADYDEEEKLKNISDGYIEDDHDAYL